MSVEIKQVSSRKELKQFVRFPETLYKHNPNYIPKLEFDQLDTLDPEKGAAQDFCDSALYLAYKDGKIVGRVAAIVNHKANKQWNHDEVRFGWYDFIDDREVSQALMDKVIEFGKKHKMDTIVGPLGFTDFDPEGLLVEGYDLEGTMALIYNHPYYVDHIVSMGFEKDADWLEYRVVIPQEIPDRWGRLSKIISERASVHVRQLTKKVIKEEDYAHKIFNLINICYKDLYNFTVLPEHMADKYIGFYLSILDLKYVSMVENDKGELVAFGITMPSISQALKKSRGKLFPFGWWHLLKSLFIKQEEGVELLLIGVRPDYQNTGINSLIFMDMFNKFHEAGFKWAETNAILETNVKHLGQLRDFELIHPKRRRSFKRAL